MEDKINLLVIKIFKIYPALGFNNQQVLAIGLKKQPMDTIWLFGGIVIRGLNFKDKLVMDL